MGFWIPVVIQSIPAWILLAFLHPLSSPSWDWPHRRAGTGSITSGFLPVGIPVLCLAATHGLPYGVSFQAGVPTDFLLGEPEFGVPVSQMLMSYW